MQMLPMLIFVSVTCGLIGLYLWFAPNRVQQRLQTISQPGVSRGPDWIESVVNIVGPFARLSAPDGDWENSPLRLSFLHAGIRHPDARLIYFGAKTLLPVVFAGVTFIAIGASPNLQGTVLALILMVAALVGCYLPNLVLWRMVTTRRREIFNNFPDAADLMLVCVEAGLGLDAGLSRVADEMRLKSMALAEELHLTNLEMRAGASREQSLRNLALRTGIEEVGTFATMLTQADRFGTSIGDSLRVFSDDLRHKRQVRAEELAAKVPTKMLVPLVLCIFPSIIMVIMGPAAIRIVRIILPMINRGG